jgi:hypothetical protein
MLKPANFSGNVVFRFTEGLLPGTGFETSANVNPYNAVIPLAYNPQSLSRASIGATGLFSGSFMHPVTGRKPRFEAVILQKRQRAVGFFTTPGVSGRVEVAPR